MKITAWSLAAALAAISLYCIAANYLLVWRQLQAKPGEKTPSMIPVIGGALGFLAVKFWPQPGWSGCAWLPPALDPGCYLAYFLIMGVARKLRR